MLCPFRNVNVKVNSMPFRQEDIYIDEQPGQIIATVDSKEVARTIHPLDRENKRNRQKDCHVLRSNSLEEGLVELLLPDLVNFVPALAASACLQHSRNLGTEI